jgi:hypothetical protein
MRIIHLIALCASLVGAGLMLATPAARAQLAVTVDFAPPPVPVYDQPPIPDAGYIWVPGYWAWSPDIGWYWVPGTWVLPPQAGLLWTPGYWAYSDGAYAFNEGYWAPEVGFYGGIDYGFGYTGDGYDGGYWNNGVFFYNTVVNNITNVAITNIFRKRVVERNRTRVSFNGGPGGVRAKPTAAQLAVARERHVPATAEQRRHAQAAAKNPALALSNNQGHPAIAATAHPGRFRGAGVMAARPGRPIPAVAPTAARGARQHAATAPATARHAPRPATPAQHLTKAPPRAAPHVVRAAPPARHLTKAAPGAAPHVVRAAPPARHVTRTAPRPAPHVARHVAPARHFTGVESRATLRRQVARPAAPVGRVGHVTRPTAPRPMMAPRVARPAAPVRPLFGAAPHGAAAPHVQAAPHVAAPRGGPPGRHR